MNKQRLVILLAFFGHLLSGYLIYILHKRVMFLETRKYSIEVKLIGADNERLPEKRR